MLAQGRPFKARGAEDVKIGKVVKERSEILSRVNK